MPYVFNKRYPAGSTTSPSAPRSTTASNTPTMSRRSTFLSKTLKRLPSHKRDYERKLSEASQKLQAAEEELYHHRRQAQLDRKKTDECQRERDAVRAKYDQLQIVVGRYAADMRQIKLLQEKTEPKDRNDAAKLRKKLNPPLKRIEEREAEAAEKPAAVRTVDAAVRTKTGEPLPVVPYAPASAPARPQNSFTCSARVAALPLILLLSTITRFLQRGPVYPEILDPFRRPVFAPGSVIQMLLLNLIVVTIVGEYAKYMLQRRVAHDQDDREQPGGVETGGAAIAHWSFTKALCEEAWYVLLLASMAFALLLFELDHVFWI